MSVDATKPADVDPIKDWPEYIRDIATALNALVVDANVQYIDSISDITSLSTSVIPVIVKSYHEDILGGESLWVWNSTGNKANHDGGNYIDPDITFPTDWTNQTQLTAWFTAVTGTGIWERQYTEDTKVEHFGAKGDGVTDDTKAITQAIASISAGEVLFGAGTYIISSTLTLPQYITLRGEGSSATTIYLDASSNTDMLISEDFATLTGQDKWLVSDGVPTGFGLIGLRFEGNKGNQTTGAGVKFYGKRYRVEDVIISNIKDVGFYSEAGASGGQSTWNDMPETYIDLQVYITGDEGVVYKGPHDGYIDKLIVSQSGQDTAADGVQFLSDGSTYHGSCYVNFIHSYSCGGNGIYMDTRIMANLIVGEACDYNGVHIASGTGRATIGVVQAYNNDNNDSDTYWNIKDEGTYTSIGRAWASADDSNAGMAGGILMAGTGSEIADCMVHGNDSDGIGVDISGNSNAISGRIVSYTATGGIGLRTNHAASKAYLRTNLTIIDCATGWTNTNSGSRSIHNITMNLTSGQTDFSGVKPSTSYYDVWNIIANVAGGDTTTSARRGTATVLDGQTSIAVTHGLITTPALLAVQLTPSESLGNATTFWTSTPTSTTFTINVDTDPGKDLNFSWDISLGM